MNQMVSLIEIRGGGLSFIQKKIHANKKTHRTAAEEESPGKNNNSPRL